MEQELTPEQSLNIINSSIAKTKENMQEHSFAFIFWGWLVTLTSITHYIIVKFFLFDYHWFIWPIAMTAGALYSVYYFYNKEKKSAYKTYLSEHLSNLWQTIFIGFLISIFIAAKLRIPVTGLILLLCGVGTLITGRAMKFKPLIYGGLSFLLFSIFSFYVTGPENLLVNAAALFIGYLVPGYLLKNSK